MEVTKVKGVLGIVTYVVEKPHALAVIFALVTLGMFLGVVPSSLLESQQAMDKKMDMMMEQHTNMMEKQEVIVGVIEKAGDISAAQTKELIQIMRGMCLIIAKQNINDTALCNP